MFLSHNIVRLFCVFNRIITHSAVAFLQPFGNILSLVPLAESVVKLNAVCMQCFKEAAYTKRIGAEKEVRRQNKEARDEVSTAHLLPSTRIKGKAILLLHFNSLYSAIYNNLQQKISPEVLDVFQ